MNHALTVEDSPRAWPRMIARKANETAGKSELLAQRLSVLSRIEQDRQVREFFSVLTSIETQVRRISTAVYASRPTLAPEHFAYLLFAGCQYLTGCHYDDLTGRALVEAVLVDLPKFADQLISLCGKKNLATHVLPRYAALQVVMAGRDQAVSIVDLGCSLGLGLQALNSDYVRRNIVVDGDIRDFLNRNGNVAKLVGVDNLGEDASELSWVKACIFPEIKERRETLEEDYFWLKHNGNQIQRVSVDFLKIPQSNLLEKNAFDVVWTSNTLYQIGTSFQSSFAALKPVLDYLLRPGGVWVDAYYRSWEREFGSPENPYQITIFPKAEAYPPNVVLLSPNDNVPSLVKGPGFAALVEFWRTK